MPLKHQKKVSVAFERSLYLLHPYNACLVTCKGENGKSNIITVAWIIPVSVDPPLLAMSIRPQRYSYNLLIESAEFVINIPTFDMAQQVLFCGRRSGWSHEKFKEASLSSQKAKIVNTPIIEECIAHLECKLVRTIELGDHVLIIGQILAAYALESYFDEVYDITKFSPCLHIGKNLFTTCIKENIEPKI
ncbi:MAG: flavin reductase family protein [Candidatus Hermodarchaeota archaeon]